MKKFLILIFFLLTHCGFQPLYSNKNYEELTFKKIELIGKKEINRRIISAVSINENKQNYKYDKVVLKNSIEITETSKNTKGQVDSFKMMLRLHFIIENNGHILRDKNFYKEFSYNNLDNKFDLSEYELNLEEDLTDKIIEDLILFLRN